MGYSPRSLKISDRTEQLQNNIIRLVLGNYERSSLRPDAGGERQSCAQATLILTLTFTKSGRARARPECGTFSCEALQGPGTVLTGLALCLMAAPMSHLRPGHTPVTNLHAPRQVPLHTAARHPGATEQTEAQPSAPLDPPSPEGADCHPFLSHHSVLLSPISLWKSSLQLFPPSEALTRFLPGPPSQPHLTEAAPSPRPSRAGPLPCPQPQHPGRRVWSEQLTCPTNTHRSHLMPQAERGAQAPGHGPPETAAPGPL